MGETYAFLLTEKAKKTLSSLINGGECLSPYILFEYQNPGVKIGVSRCLSSNSHFLAFGSIPYTSENWDQCVSWWNLSGGYEQHSLLPIDFIWEVGSTIVFGILGNQPCYLSSVISGACCESEDLFVDTIQRYLDAYFRHGGRNIKSSGLRESSVSVRDGSLGETNSRPVPRHQGYRG